MATKMQLRVKNIWRCGQHGDQNVILCCVTCGDVLICTKCVTSIHIKHDYCQFEEVLTRKKKSLESLLQKYENEIIPVLKQQLKNVLDKQKLNKELTVQLVQSITQRGEEMKEEIDKYTDGLIGICKTIQAKQEKELQQTESDIVQQQNTASDKRNNLQEILKRLILPEMVDASSNANLGQPTASFETDDKYLELGLTFVSRPKGEGMQTLKDLYGTLQPLQGEIPYLDVDLELYRLCLVTVEFLGKIDKERNRSNVDDTIRLLIDEQRKLQFPLSYDCLVPREGGMMLAKRDSTASILLLSASRGKLVKKNLVTKYGFAGFTYCTRLGTLGADHHTVCQIGSDGEPSQPVFQNINYPKDLATYSEGQFLVGHYDGFVHNVVHFEAESGTELGKYRLKSYPQRVRVNRSSQDVAIVYNFQMILVLDRNLTSRFWYCGLMDSTPGKPDDLTQNRMRSLFKPVDVCFDSHGRILIADQVTKSVIALNSNGKFLKVVVGFQNVPVALAVDSQDLLWVSLDDNTVRIIKYTN